MIDRSPGDIEARGFANDCNPRVRRLYDRCTCRSAKDRLAPLDILEELDEVCMMNGREIQDPAFYEF